MRNIKNIDNKSDCTTGLFIYIPLRETPEDDGDDALKTSLNQVVKLVSLSTHDVA